MFKIAIIVLSLLRHLVVDYLLFSGCVDGRVVHSALLSNRFSLSPQRLGRRVTGTQFVRAPAGMDDDRVRIVHHLNSSFVAFALP